MKFLGLTLASLGLASAASIATKVSYDGWQVYRVTVGDNKAKLKSVVNRLQLETWKGKIDSSAVVDVVVPPSQVDAFAASGLNSKLLHDDLGLSIADETSFGVYAAGIAPWHTFIYPRLMIYQQHPRLALPPLQMPLGSTHTTPLPTISNGSRILPPHTPTTPRCS